MNEKKEEVIDIDGIIAGALTLSAIMLAAYFGAKRGAKKAVDAMCVNIHIV